MSNPTHKAVAVIEQSGEHDGINPVVRAMLAQSPDPATLRDLLAVQKEWEAGESRKAYTRAIVDLKRDLPTTIARDKSVAFGTTKYTHTSLAAVMDAITEPLAKHGFSIAWVPSTDRDGVSVKCTLTHSAGHSESATITAPRDDKGSKSHAQGVASTITLLSRYTALAILGIATADMVEPVGVTATARGAVDSARNLRAAAALRKHGRTREQAEEMLGRSVSEWTGEDIDELRAWVSAGGGATKQDIPHPDDMPSFDGGKP